MRWTLPALILVLAAAIGVGGGALTARALEDDAPVSEPRDPEGLLYFADQIIWDDDLTRTHLLPAGVRVGELTRKADGGWIVKEEWGGDKGRLVMQDEDDRRYGVRRIGDVGFDVSYDLTRLAYPAGDRVEVVSTLTGKPTDTVDVGLATVDAVFFSGENLLASGPDATGKGQVVLWDTTRQATTPVRFGIDGDVRLVDVSASGGHVVVEGGRTGSSCVAVFAVSRPGEAVWRDDDCESRAYPDALSSDGSHLITYPDAGTPTLPGKVTVIDLDDPDGTVSIGGGDIADAGWTDDGQLAVISQHNTEPKTYEILSCTLDGACVSELGTRGSVAKVGRVD